MNLNGQEPKTNFDQSRLLIEPVYRYHLVRSENYLEAQAFTIYTFRQAMKWRQPDPDKERVRVMTIARYQQAHGKRQHLLIPADQTPPEQEEVQLREQVGRLADAWRKIPRNQADAMALHYFGSLSLAETGEVLGKNAEEIQDLISQGAGLEDELYHLANDIHPPDDLDASLFNGIERSPDNAPPPVVSEWGSAWFWRTVFRLRGAFSSGLKAGQTGLLVILLVVGLYIVIHQPTRLQSPAPTTAAMPTPTPIPQTYTLLEIPNALVPPASSVCQTWKTNLEDLMANDFSESSPQTFSDPTGENPGISGTGCELTAEISGPGQDNAPKTLRNINWLFKVNEFGQGAGFGNLPGKPATAFFLQDCPGFGRVFQKSNLYAFLSISYCTSSSNLATAIAPSQNIVRGYKIRMFLATGTIQTDLSQFFDLWAAGNDQAISYLSPDLLKDFRSVHGLDRQVGISRTISSTIEFNWQPVKNLGTSMQIVVWINELGSPSQLWSIVPSFQMDLVQKGGAWQVTNVSNTIQFSSVSRSTPPANPGSPK